MILQELKHEVGFREQFEIIFGFSNKQLVETGPRFAEPKKEIIISLI